MKPDKKYHIKLNKKLMKEINEWKYQMAYFTEEDIPTSQGVNKWVHKLMDLLAKEKK